MLVSNPEETLRNALNLGNQRIDKITAILCFVIGGSMYLATRDIRMTFAIFEGALFLALARMAKKGKAVTASVLSIGLHSIAVIYFGTILRDYVNAKWMVFFLSGICIFNVQKPLYKWLCAVFPLIAFCFIHFQILWDVLPPVFFPGTLTGPATQFSMAAILILSLLTFYNLYKSISSLIDKLNTQKSELAALHNKKSAYVQEINHDIRNSLTVLMNLGDMLVNGNYPTGEREKLYGPLLASIAHMNLSVNNVMHSERMEIGAEYILNNRETDIDKLLSEQIETFRWLAMNEAIEINYHHTLNGNYLLDSQLLLEIFKNLIVNAIKYSKKGSRVEVSVDHQQGQLIVSVKDHGMGIPLDEQEWIFRPFATKNVGRGPSSGIGLAVSRDKAVLMGGKLTVESKVGEGSCFSLIVPATKMERQIDLPASLNLNNLYVLILEDDLGIQSFLSNIIAKFNGKPVRALTISEARGVLATMPIGLILTDIRLPDGSGLDFISSLKNKSIPVIVSSSPSIKLTDEDILKQTGAIAIVSKPFVQSHLVEALSRYPIVA